MAYGFSLGETQQPDFINTKPGQGSTQLDQLGTLPGSVLQLRIINTYYALDVSSFRGALYYKLHIASRGRGIYTKGGGWIYTEGGGWIFKWSTKIFECCSVLSVAEPNNQ